MRLANTRRLDDQTRDTLRNDFSALLLGIDLREIKPVRVLQLTNTLADIHADLESQWSDTELAEELVKISAFPIRAEFFNYSLNKGTEGPGVPSLRSGHIQTRNHSTTDSETCDELPEVLVDCNETIYDRNFELICGISFDNDLELPKFLTENPTMPTIIVRARQLLRETFGSDAELEESFITDPDMAGPYYCITVRVQEYQDWFLGRLDAVADAVVDDLGIEFAALLHLTTDFASPHHSSAV